MYNDTMEYYSVIKKNALLIQATTDESHSNYAEWKKPGESIYHMVLLRQDWEGRGYQRAREHFGSDGRVNYLDCGNGFMGIYICTYVKMYKLYKLNMCNLLYDI